MYNIRSKSGYCGFGHNWGFSRKYSFTCSDSISLVHNGLNDRTIEEFFTFCVFLCKIIGISLFADAECLMNAKLVPIPLFDKKTKAPIDRSNPDTQRGIK